MGVKRIALVTGGGANLGKGMCLRLASDGFAVVVNDLKLDAAQATVNKIVGVGGVATAVGGDVSSPEDVAAIFAHAVDTYGRVDLLVNNAGFLKSGYLTELSIEDIDRMFDVHVRGTFLCTKAVLPEMLARGDGIIVNIASQLGQVGGVQLTHYSAAKAAIIGLTKSLAREVSRRGVRVNAVAPGAIDTPMLHSMDEAWKSAKLAELPLGRWGTVVEVAASVAFLASDSATNFVGQTICPNSGDVML